MKRSLFRKKPYLNPEGLKICRFKKGDRLQVLTGKETDKIGALIKINTKDATVLISEVNKVTYCPKAGAKGGENRERAQKEAPLHVSNVALVCPSCGKPTRIAYAFVPPAGTDEKTRKVRVCKRCRAQIDN